MKIGIAREGNVVSGHFGHCEGFQVYEVENGQVISENFLQNPGHQPGVLPPFLAQNGVNVVIAGGMGAKAQELFAEQNIQVIVGARGSLEEAIKTYLEGSLKSTGSVCKEHAHEGHCNE